MRPCAASGESKSPTEACRQSRRQSLKTPPQTTCNAPENILFLIRECYHSRNPAKTLPHPPECLFLFYCFRGLRPRLQTPAIPGRASQRENVFYKRARGNRHSVNEILAAPVNGVENFRAVNSAFRNFKRQMRIGPMEKIVAIRNLFAARIRDADDRLEPPGRRRICMEAAFCPIRR